MPRPLRVHLPGGFYHATLRGNHQQAIFLIAADRLRLNDIVADALRRYEAKLHAYCWMTNHLHFLIQVQSQPLGLVMRQIASDYARAFQRKLQTTGHLFERRYHARIVDVERYLFRLLRYIHLNPVAAGLADSVGDYRWSSHHDYAGTVAAPWMTTEFVLKMFSSNRRQAVAAYLQFMDCDREDAVDPLEDAAPQPKDLERTPAPVGQRAPQPGSESLDKIIADACVRFEVTLHQLRSDCRDLYLMQVRAWITRYALESRVANLSQIARSLGRDRATLRNAMERYPKEPE